MLEHAISSMTSLSLIRRTWSTSGRSELSWRSSNSPDMRSRLQVKSSTSRTRIRALRVSAFASRRACCLSRRGPQIARTTTAVAAIACAQPAQLMLHNQDKTQLQSVHKCIWLPPKMLQVRMPYLTNWRQTRRWPHKDRDPTLPSPLRSGRRRHRHHDHHGRIRPPSRRRAVP